MSADLVGHVLDHGRFRYQVATSTESRAAALWEPKGPRLLLRGHRSALDGVQFFPLGDRTLTWGPDGAAIIWDAASGRMLRVLRHEGPVECARVFPSGERVATCNEDGSTTVWDARSGKKLAKFEPEESHSFTVLAGLLLRDIEVSPQGAMMLTWDGHGATVWDIANRRRWCKLFGHTSEITSAKAFPRGDKWITGSFDRRALIWDASSCKALHRLRHGNWVTGVGVLGEAGDEVATITAGGSITVWTVATGRKRWSALHPIAGSLDYAKEVLAFPQGGRLLTFTRGGGDGVAAIWNATSGEKMAELDGGLFPVHGAAVAPGGDMVATCGSGQVIIWSARSGEPVSWLTERSSLNLLGERHAGRCSVAVGLAGLLDPAGFGPGLPWRALA